MRELVNRAAWIGAAAALLPPAIAMVAICAVALWLTEPRDGGVR